MDPQVPLKSKQSVINLDPADPECETDFKKAYLKLVKKVYEEQGPNILITQEELNKVVDKDQFRQEEFISKVQ